MPQFDPSSFSSQLFWLALTFVALYLLLWRTVLPRISSVLEQRQEKIEDDLGRAEKLRAEAEEVLAAYRKALDDARAKAQADIKATAAAMAEAAGKRHQAFTAELAGRAKEAEASIAKAKDGAIAQLRSVAADSAVAATARLIGVQVSEAEAGKAIDQVGSQPAGQPREGGG